MTYESTDRYAERPGARVDPRVDPALRQDRHPAARRGGPTAIWIVAGILVFIAILAIWGGLFTTSPTVTETAPPPAAEAPVTAPAPEPVPAPAPAPAQ